MPFPPDLLNRDEDIVVDTKPHWWEIVPSAGVLTLAVILGLLVLAAGWPDPLKILVALVVLVALGFFATRYSQWITTNFVVTTDRVIYRTGVFAKHGTEIPVEKINTVHYHQRIFERILGLGNIEIESASTEGESAFSNVRKPALIQNIIYQQMDDHDKKNFEQMGHAVAAAAPNVAPQQHVAESIPDQIKKLDDLRRAGTITEAEFQEKKAQLLDRM